MARPTDETKLQAIRKAAMQMVVEQGLSGASISQIARKAGVSDGYLYRFYSGKRELLESLFLERFQGIHDMLRMQMISCSTVKDLVEALLQKVYASAQGDWETIAFYHKLLNDFSFEIPEDNRLRMTGLCEQIVRMGKNNGEIGNSVTTEQFFAIVIGGTLQFINFRLRGIFANDAFTRDDIDRNTEFILKALK